MADRQLLHRTPEGLRLEIPSPKSGISLIFTTFLILFGIVGLPAIVLQALAELGGMRLFAIYIAASLILTYVALIPRILWALFGKEVINISFDGIKISRTFLRIGGKTHYRASEISNLRVREVENRPFVAFPEDSPKDFARMAFDCNEKTIYFGLGLKPGEEIVLLEEISKAFPNFLEKRSPHQLALSLNGSVQLNHARLIWNGNSLTLGPKPVRFFSTLLVNVVLTLMFLLVALPLIDKSSTFGIIVLVFLLSPMIFNLGYEQISISYQGIRIGRRMGLIFSRFYRASEIRQLGPNDQEDFTTLKTAADVRLSRDFSPGEGFRQGLQIPAFKFEFQTKKVTFGRNLQEAEARIILATIQKYFPEYFKDS